MTFKKLDVQASAGDGVDPSHMTQALMAFRDALRATPPLYVLQTTNPAVDRLQPLLALMTKVASVRSSVTLLDQPPQEHKLDPNDPKKWVDSEGAYCVHVDVPDDPAQPPANYKPSILISVLP